jgi:hypothetical protein
MIYPNGRILDYDYSPSQQPVTTLSSVGTTATATTAAADGLSAGDKVVIEGAGAPYDGTFTVASIINSTQFTYTLGSSFTGSSSGTDISAGKLSLDSTISRVDGEQDHGGSSAGQVLEGYSYLGLNTIVQRTRPDGANLSYVSQPNDPNPPVTTAPGGDRYTGLDAFGRVIDQLWGPATSPTERYQYAYDRDGNVLYKNDLVNPSDSELYHANGVAENSSYDDLNRLQSFARGTLSASGNNGSMLDQITAPSASQTWTLDALGNWSGDSGQSNGTETRTFNAQNQITEADGDSTINVTYDNNGNMIGDGGGNAYVYDAWNRLIKLEQSGFALETRSYYATGEMSSDTDNCQSVTTQSYYSMDWQAVEDDTRTGSGFPPPPFVVANQYVWGLGYVDDLVLRDDNSTTGSLGVTASHLGRRIFSQQDANWNVAALVSSSGSVLQRFQYNPYGSGSSNTFGWV